MATKYTAMNITPFDSKREIVDKINHFKNNTFGGILVAQDALKRIGEDDKKTVATLAVACCILLGDVENDKTLMQLSDLADAYYRLHNEIDELLMMKLGYVA